MRAHAANLLTAVRLLAAAGWVVSFAAARERRIPLGAIATAAALSDFLDGRLARLLGTSGNLGRWLDGLADVAFVLVVLGCEAEVGAIPVYIPLLIAASFAQYAVDSMMMSGGSGAPIRSRLGHWGGVVNYALALALSFAPPPARAGTLVRSAAPLLAVYYVAAMVERAVLLYGPRILRR